MGNRLHFIDWLRVLAVLLLFPFHTGRVYNEFEAFYVKAPRLSVGVSVMLGFIDNWHMPLLFLLAGASSYFALSHRNGGQYVAERVKRLLVPLVFGLVVLIPPQTWYGARFNSGYTRSFFEYIASGDFLAWNIRDGGDFYGGFGMGHLWFILWLFAISLLVLPLMLWGRGERGSASLARWATRFAHPGWWLLAALLILIGEALPDFAGKNMFYYAAFFVLGYVVMFDGRFMEAAERYRWPALVAGAVLAMVWTLTGQLRDSLPDPSFPLVALVFVGEIGKWSMIVGLLGFGRRYLNRPSPALSYLTEGSYPLYILHQTVIVVLAFYVVTVPVVWWLQWMLLLALAVGATFAVYEIVRRIDVLRFLFGMKPKPTAENVVATVPKRAV